ncbi:2-O-methyltransferase NoeI [Mariprofundus micogutta]|uniref:2-O-methyltransferase NoeI n=1 Tax=Mariprofundus micogutta TaxID=1921010 RepID=A0A1L8CLU5_9PROT|nr:FkbM family methyltransferase [Mariprofundus micogutta]GAV19882.1 2-O-methyltransferase NoeI [Mariprofundus micogutta]
MKEAIKSILKSINLYYNKPYNVPENTLLGIKSLSIKTIIDIGANEGQFAKSILQTFPSARLFCFEPLPNAFTALESWKKETGKDVTIFNVALGDNEGVVAMNLHVDHSTSSSILQSTRNNDELFPETANQTKIDVKMTTLDKALSSLSNMLVEDIFIKVDVQGFEVKVIEGGQGIFRLAKAVILEVCVESLYDGQSEFTTILGKMEKLGFKYSGNLQQYYDKQDGRTQFFDAVFLKK